MESGLGCREMEAESKFRSFPVTFSNCLVGVSFRLFLNETGQALSNF